MYYKFDFHSKFRVLNLHIFYFLMQNIDKDADQWLLNMTNQHLVFDQIGENWKRKYMIRNPMKKIFIGK